MATQKQQISTLQDVAFAQDVKLSIRKNSYGEYELRMKGRNLAPFLYGADSFVDAVQTAQYELAEAAKKNEKEERDLDREYERELQQAISNARTILALVGCTIHTDQTGASDTVVLYSPKTGSHSLNMKRGVRPVSDLLTHVAGFAEQQMHVKVDAKTLHVKHDLPLYEGETGVLLSVDEQDGSCRVQWAANPKQPVVQPQYIGKHNLRDLTFID